MSVFVAAGNVGRVVINRAAKLVRQGRHWFLRRQKDVREGQKHATAQLRTGTDKSRDVARLAYSGVVRSSRYWERLRRRTWSSVARDIDARRTLRRIAAGDGPILVGPWLSEVGYEALYWVPFLRWFVKHYRVDPARVTVLSRGGVASWYDGIGSRYLEQFDLFTPEELTARNEARRGSNDQKQLGISMLDDEIVSRARDVLGLDRPTVCHPSVMFTLLRQFWLGNESLQTVLEYTDCGPIGIDSQVRLPPLPDRFVAVKFYTGRALPDTPVNRDRLRAIVERLAADLPIVTLNTNFAFDEHEDYVFRHVPGVTTLDGWVTPQNNLAVQTEVIRRAQRFVGTCGSLAWLAPMLGTDTLALYADDHFLTSHLYAAPHLYATMDAARFTALDITAFDHVDLLRSGPAR